MAFDHERIVRDALARAQTELERTDLALSFVPEKFTVPELRAVFEVIWGVKLEPANFRRSLLTGAAIEPTGDISPAGRAGGRPPQRYEASSVWESGAPVRRPA